MVLSNICGNCCSGISLLAWYYGNWTLKFVSASENDQLPQYQNNGEMSAQILFYLTNQIHNLLIWRIQPCMVISSTTYEYNAWLSLISYSVAISIWFTHNSLNSLNYDCIDDLFLNSIFFRFQMKMTVAMSTVTVESLFHPSPIIIQTTVHRLWIW